MAEVKHTPLPFTASHGWHDTGPDPKYPDYCEINGGSFGERNRFSLSGHCRMENATFIVRACNSHYDLLDALEMIRDADNDCEKDGLQRIPAVARAKIDAAIAKAKGAA